MSVDTTFAREFLARLDQVRGLDSTSNRKFAEFESWFLDRSERTLAVSYVHGLQKQFTARLGAALMATPDVIVLLSTESWKATRTGGRSYVARLEEMVKYVGGLHAVIACCGVEGRWRVECVVGPKNSVLRQRLGEVLGDGIDVPVDRSI